MKTYLSHGGPNIQHAPQPNDELMVATIDGTVTLQREGPGTLWPETGRALPGKHISSLLKAPSGGRLFAGAHTLGLFASDDDGQTWQVKVKGLVSQHVYSMNYAEVDGRLLLYAGTEPANLHVSADLGESWDVLPAVNFAPSVEKWRFPGFGSNPAHLKSIGFDPRTPTTIYACVEVGALLKSTDGGTTWRELTGEGTGLYEDTHRVAIPPYDPEHVYVATGNGIYHSRQGGEHWERLTDQTLRVGYPDGLLLHPERPDLLFTSGAAVWPRDWGKRGSADPRVMRSRDGGRNWEVVGRGMPEHLHGNIEAMVMNVWPSGYALYAGTTDGDIFQSEDEGENWSLIASGLPAISKTSHYQSLERLKQQQAAQAAAG